MKKTILPPGRSFLFELEFEISPMLSLAPGELGTLILDGLFALDEQKGLFPGVSTPPSGERIVAAAIKAIGYARPANLNPAIPSQTKQAGKSAAPLSEDDKATIAALRNAWFEVEAIMTEQRMLLAKIMGFVEPFNGPVPLVAAEREAALGLLKASTALVTHHRVRGSCFIQY